MYDLPAGRCGVYDGVFWVFQIEDFVLHTSYLVLQFNRMS